MDIYGESWYALSPVSVFSFHVWPSPSQYIRLLIASLRS